MCDVHRGVSVWVLESFVIIVSFVPQLLFLRLNAKADHLRLLFLS
jgi:hypothetical protein